MVINMENFTDSPQNCSENRENRRAAIWFSRLFLLLCLGALLYVSSICIPGVRTALRGAAEGRTVQAFSALTDSLQDGSGISSAFSESYRVLIGDEG